tara:strand:+ start:868 stop:1098 length:231 start_codon:yes stop_codon:yes gene_type:complete
MNERIRELAEQAVWFYLDPDSNAYEAQIHPEDLEVFAELIVRECAEVCFSIDKEYEGEDVLATWCADGILKHFGVE